MQLAIRAALWLMAHTILKVEIAGRGNIPRRGPALLASNHISYADGFLIAYCIKAPIRFMAWTPFFQMPGFRWALQLIRAIPVGFGGRRETLESIFRARQELAAGQLVCIFPEGSMTRDGELHPFKRGMEKIAEGLQVPIVPVHIDGLWGSVFSIEGERWRWRRPRRLPYRVTIRFGEHMPAWSRAGDVRQSIQLLAVKVAPTTTVTRCVIPLLQAPAPKGIDPAIEFTPHNQATDPMPRAIVPPVCDAAPSR